jgi:hypothetical protein
MVIQKVWNNVEASQQSSSENNSDNSSWNFQAPAKTLTARPNDTTAATMQVSSFNCFFREP